MAAVYGVAHSRTRMTRLSSSSSSIAKRVYGVLSQQHFTLWGRRATQSLAGKRENVTEIGKVRWHFPSDELSRSHCHPWVKKSASPCCPSQKGNSEPTSFKERSSTGQVGGRRKRGARGGRGRRGLTGTAPPRRCQATGPGSRGRRVGGGAGSGERWRRAAAEKRARRRRGRRGRGPQARGTCRCGGRCGWGMCGAVPVAVELPQTRPGTELGLRGSPPGSTPGRGVGRKECRRPALSGVPAAFPLHPSCRLRSSC